MKSKQEFIKIRETYGDSGTKIRAENYNSVSNFAAQIPLKN